MAAKKLGLGRAGTGKVSAQEQKSSEKWTQSIKSQLSVASTSTAPLSKSIPIDYVLTDPDNPRKLAISKEEVTKFAQKYPFSKKSISADNADVWIEHYIEDVTKTCGFTGKKLGDIISIIEFAAALKSAERLVHPISVLKDETTFHLIAGERRLFAHILLGETHISATIQSRTMDRVEIDTLQWEENVHRENMTLWEKVDRVRKIIEATDGFESTSVTKLSKRIGRGRAEAQRYLAVLRYPHKILIEAIEQGKITDLKKAAALAQLSEQDIRGSLEGESRPTPPKPSVRFSRDINTDGLRKVLEAAAQNLGESTALSEFDLNKPAGLAAALEALVRKV